MEIHLKNWSKIFLNELSKSKELKIISPFVNEQIIRKINSQFNFKNFELVTRFNLQDFAMNVSSLASLKFILENNGKVFGIKGLHSKVYLFDKRFAIITSANLTNGGLKNNFECGLCLTDKEIIQKLHIYFNELKVIPGNKLTIDLINEWESILAGIEIKKGKEIILPDYGASLESIDKNRNYYIKFFGKADSRESLNYLVTDGIKKSYCHYACGFPKNKKPRQVNNGDVIFMARMTKDPNDYAIFGKAIALKYVDGRDVASKIEKKELPWKKKWPVYLRIKNPVFVNGKMLDCVLLSELINKFDYDSFPSTRERYDNGERDINPKLSIMRKAYVKLTHNSAEWLNQRFNAALNNAGKVDENFLKSLPTTTTDLTLWK